MNVEMVLGLVRHILTFAGGWLVSQGVLTEPNAQAIIGAVVTIIGVAWSAVIKKQIPLIPPSPPKAGL